MKKAVTISLFLILNGTWAWIAYLLHITGVPPRVIAVMVAIGIVIGNAAAYAGLKVAERLLRKNGA